MKTPRRRTKQEIAQKLLSHFSTPQMVDGLHKRPEFAQYEPQDVRNVLRGLRFAGIIKDLAGDRRDLSCIVDHEAIRKLVPVLEDAAQTAEDWYPKEVAPFIEPGLFDAVREAQRLYPR